MGIGFEDIPLLEQLESSGGWMGAQPEASPVPSIDLKDGLELQIGSEMISILATPGHTPGGVCFLVEDVIFSGVSVFNESIGRYDLPGGDGVQLLESIRTKLMVLPENMIVLPGHGGETTISHEKQYNPFLQN